MQSGSLAFRNGHRSCRLSIPLCCHIQPIRFRETEIIARRIETAIPVPFNRSYCTKRWKTLETPERFLRFGCSIFSHRRETSQQDLERQRRDRRTWLKIDELAWNSMSISRDESPPGFSRSHRCRG